MDEPSADNERDRQRRDPEHLDPPPGLVGEGLADESTHHRGARDLDPDVREQRQRDHGEPRRDHEGHPPVDPGANEDAADPERRRDAEREAGAEEAEQSHASDGTRVSRNEQH